MNRCFVLQYHGKNRATFGCRQGHTWRAALVIGKHTNKIGEGARQMLARWWSKDRGGVTMDCPKCKAARQ